MIDGWISAPLPRILLQEDEAPQGRGEKCWRLKEGGPPGAEPCRYTGLPVMLVVKLVSAVEEEDMGLPEGSIGCIPESSTRQITCSVTHLNGLLYNGRLIGYE